MADSLISEVEERWRAAKQVRKLFEQPWLLNIAYYLGHQWVRVDGSGRVWDVVGDGDLADRVTLVDNRIRVNVRSSIAKQTKTGPTWVGVPKNGGDEEMARARLRTHAFEHYWRELDARRRLRLALWWREVTGIGWWKVTWDHTLGETIRVVALRDGPVITQNNGAPFPAEQAPVVAQQLPEGMREQVEERHVTFGDPVLRVKTPFEVAIDPLATEEGLSTAEYIVEDGIYSPAYLERVYHVDRDRLDESADLSAGPLESRFPGLTRYLDSTHTGAPGRRGVKTREYWSLPGVDDPKGRHVVWTADGEVLLEEAIPYPFLPYSAFHGLPSGRFYADAPVNDQISPQTELNKTKSQIAENGERFGNPARLRSRESIDQGSGDWQGIPGEEVVYHDLGTPGSVPQFLGPPEMPQYVQMLPQQAIEALNVISGHSEIAQGQVPEGVTAASAISQLIESSDTMIGPEIGDMADALLDCGKKLLWLVGRFATTERLLRIAGNDEAWDVYTFRGQELGNPDADELDIGSGLPESKAQKQAAIQFMLNLLIQNGQPLPPRELRRILRDFEVGGLDHFFAATNRTQAQVAEEHRRFLQGEIFGINTYDDDALHVEEHQDFQRGTRYAELRRTASGRRIQTIIDAHVMMHTQRMQAQATQQAMAQAAQTALETGQPGPEPAAGDPAGGDATGQVTEPPAPPAPPDALPFAPGSSTSTGGS